MGNIIGRMSSLSVVEGESEATPLLNDVEEADIVREISDFLKFKKPKTSEENNTEQTKVTKRKRRLEEEDVQPNILTEVFLRIIYPISACMSKSVSIGLVKSLDYSPTVLLNHGTKMVLFSENAWESFLKHLHLIECYLTTNVCGRKTNIRLLESDNEIDVVKHRGVLQMRIRDLSQHDNKIMLSREEFFALNYAATPITRYMRQLVFSSSVIKEYLVDTLEKQPDSTILYGHVDTSIFNRLPHEVEMWRQLRKMEVPTEETSKKEEETTKQEEEEETTKQEKENGQNN